jgi:hypothetical protein
MIFAPFGGNAQLGLMFLLFRRGLAVVTSGGRPAPIVEHAFAPGRETVRHFHTSRFGLDRSMG